MTAIHINDICWRQCHSGPLLVVGGYALQSICMYICMPVLDNEKTTATPITRYTVTDDRKNKISRHIRLSQSRTDISNNCVFDLRDWTDNERGSLPLDY